MNPNYLNSIKYENILLSVENKTFTTRIMNKINNNSYIIRVEKLEVFAFILFSVILITQFKKLLFKQSLWATAVAGIKHLADGTCGPPRECVARVRSEERVAQSRVRVEDKHVRQERPDARVNDVALVLLRPAHEHDPSLFIW